MKLSFNSKELGKYIKRSRQLRNVTFLNLAKKSGVSKGLLSKIENGCGNPTVNTLYKLSKALNVIFTINGVTK